MPPRSIKRGLTFHDDVPKEATAEQQSSIFAAFSEQPEWVKRLKRRRTDVGSQHLDTTSQQHMEHTPSAHRTTPQREILMTASTAKEASDAEKEPMRGQSGTSHHESELEDDRDPSSSSRTIMEDDDDSSASVCNDKGKQPVRDPPARVSLGDTIPSNIHHGRQRSSMDSERAIDRTISPEAEEHCSPGSMS